jgi:hypothetical protein
LSFKVLGPVSQTNMEGPYRFKYGPSILVLWLSNTPKMVPPFYRGHLVSNHI